MESFRETTPNLICQRLQHTHNSHRVDSRKGERFPRICTRQWVTYNQPAQSASGCTYSMTSGKVISKKIKITQKWYQQALITLAVIADQRPHFRQPASHANEQDGGYQPGMNMLCKTVRKRLPGDTKEERYMTVARPSDATRFLMPYRFPAFREK